MSEKKPINTEKSLEKIKEQLKERHQYITRVIATGNINQRSKITKSD